MAIKFENLSIRLNFKFNLETILKKSIKWFFMDKLLVFLLKLLHSNLLCLYNVKTLFKRNVF